MQILVKSAYRINLLGFNFASGLLGLNFQKDKKSRRVPGDVKAEQFLAHTNILVLPRSGHEGIVSSHSFSRSFLTGGWKGTNSPKLGHKYQAKSITKTWNPNSNHTSLHCLHKQKDSFICHIFTIAAALFRPVLSPRPGQK